MFEGLKLTIPLRLQFLRIVITFSLVISVCLSLKLWGGYHYFPHVPVFDFKFSIVPYDAIIIGLSCVFLIASVFFKKTRTLIFLAVLLNISLVIFDLNRLQPWFYYYNVILFIFLFYNGRVDDSNKYTSIFIILQFIIASVYVYNGFSKVNSNFVIEDFVKIISPLKFFLTERQFIFISKIGTIIPYVLIFIGFGLIITPIRYLAITLGCFVHICLFVFLFPSATNQNYALWLMNIVFLVVLFILFSGKTKQRYFSPAILFQKPLFYLVMILFWILPFFNSQNKWPNNLSANYKSSNSSSLNLIINEEQHSELPLYIKFFFIKKDTLYILQYNDWCLNELKTDCYPENELFTAIYLQLAKPLPYFVKETQFIIKPKQTLFTTK
ncbi:MAG: hypothetical protein SFY56_00585 [Bacteroidota bacterium]|nr:hypothetical protein [Bacteroidota bacterium]